MKYVKLAVYEYDELSEKAKTRAINDLIENYYFSIKYEELSPAMQRAVDEVERLKTPWFAGQVMWQYAREEIEAEARRWNYTRDGELWDWKGK